MSYEIEICDQAGNPNYYTIADYDYTAPGRFNDRYNHRDPSFTAEEIVLTEVFDESGTDVTKTICDCVREELEERMLEIIHEEQEQYADEYEPDFEY